MSAVIASGTAAPVTANDRAGDLQVLVAGVAWPVETSASAGNAAAVGRSAGRPHPLGVQTVAIERAIEKHSPRGERMHLYQFDHTTGLARRVLIDATGTRVLEQRLTAGVHLPLTEAETAWALQRVQISALPPSPDAVLDPTADARRAPTAFVFEPADPDDVCRAVRCALLAFRDTSGEVLADERVVEFPTGRVRPLPVAPQ